MIPLREMRRLPAGSCLLESGQPLPLQHHLKGWDASCCNSIHTYLLLVPLNSLRTPFCSLLSPPCPALSLLILEGAQDNLCFPDKFFLEVLDSEAEWENLPLTEAVSGKYTWGGAQRVHVDAGRKEQICPMHGTFRDNYQRILH